MIPVLRTLAHVEKAIRFRRQWKPGRQRFLALKACDRRIGTMRQTGEITPGKAAELRRQFMQDLKDSQRKWKEEREQDTGT